MNQPDPVVRMHPLLICAFWVRLRPALAKLPRNNLSRSARIEPGNAIDARCGSDRVLALRVAQSPRSHFKATVGRVASPDYQLVVNVATSKVVVVV